MGCDAGRFLTPSISRKEPFDPLSHRIRFGNVRSRSEPLCCSIFYLYLSSLTARAQFVEHHGQDDDCALDNQLPVKGDVHQRESIIKDGDDQRSDQRPKDCSNSADETGATQNNRCDRIQLVPYAQLALGTVKTTSASRRRDPIEVR